MARMYAAFRIGKFHSDKYTQAVMRTMEGIVRLAAAEFMIAALSRVPIHTGMAAGSFLNVGRYVRTQLLQRAKTIGPDAPDAASRLGGALVIKPNPRLRTVKRKLKGGQVKEYVTRNMPKWYYHPGGRRLPKTPESGASLATKPAATFKVSGLRVTFTFNTRVHHYNINEFFDGGSYTAPWHSLERGREAYNRTMQKAKELLPQFQQFIARTTISLGPGNKIVEREEPLPTPDVREVKF